MPERPCLDCECCRRWIPTMTTGGPPPGYDEPGAWHNLMRTPPPPELIPGFKPVEDIDQLKVLADSLKKSGPGYGLWYSGTAETPTDAPTDAEWTD